jgi:prepilin-type N-terminal cleavage/methylation domain-containing protein/prepilin-type processing-associated H-X9-DG protein
MLRKRGFTLIELLVVIAIIAVLAAILFPVFARARRAAQASNCQSNMKQIGNAVKMYLSDWQDTYPTNRPFYGSALQSLQWAVSLSPLTLATVQDQPKFIYGINWVEGLYQYVESITKSTDPASVWKCQSASAQEHPTNYNNRAVTYAFNSCLAESPEGITKSAANLMMIRETGYLTVSTVRPTNTATPSTGNPSAVPVYPFLNGRDTPLGFDATKMNKLHGNGSDILFADGHVKSFPVTYFPQTIGTSCWDNDTQQWYNFRFANPTSSDQKAKNMSIAITP